VSASYKIEAIVEKYLMKLVWTDYMRYKARLRGFNLAKIEDVVRYSAERYFDTKTARWIVIGRHDNWLVAIPYEAHHETITPITIHTVTRQQIQFRIKTGRYTIE
jgi:hypothetical protein